MDYKMLNHNVYSKDNLACMLLSEGKIINGDLEKVLEIKKQQNKKLIEILVEFNYISEKDLINFISEKMNIDKVDLSEINISDSIIEKVPKEIAKKYNLIPFKEDDQNIYIATDDPTDLIAIDDIRFIVYKNVKACISTKREVNLAIEKYYNKKNSDKALADLKQEYGEEFVEKKDSTSSNNVDDAPTVRLANSILTQAIDVKASDIHIEPFENEVLVRYRIDGVIKDIMTLPKNIYAAVSTRIKIISEMDIAEKRIPQDGRIEMKVASVPYDFRVSTLPTVFGEKIVMRILDRSGSLVSRDKLGFTEHEEKIIDKVLGMPHGILLVTGPTGSGKTTTLYSFLSEMNTPDKNIITIEDPAEYRLHRINQVQVNPKAGLTFAAGLRSMLRQDPDIIMIGEIRDEETAQIAVKASITGHFVLSTLHTNDAPSTITRLIDMGLQSYLVADALVGVIAQRLIRKVCSECKESYIAQDWEMEALGTDKPITLYKGIGCSKCNNTGYKGRIAIHEVMYIDKNVRAAIEANKGVEEIREAALKSGMVTLFENCKELVEKGGTTVKEMVKVVYARD